ncbi:hypothetical protein FXO37_28029 [Capsicum annuum]|nr:hypothetical protein FXO37_28029 [Capsicum annuum]
MATCMASLYSPSVPAKQCRSRFIFLLCRLSVTLSTTRLLALDFIRGNASVRVVISRCCSWGKLQALHAWGRVESASSIGGRKHGWLVRASCSSCEITLTALHCALVLAIRGVIPDRVLAFDFGRGGAFVSATSSRCCSRGKLQALHVWGRAESTSSTGDQRGGLSCISFGAASSPLLPLKMGYRVKKDFL